MISYYDQLSSVDHACVVNRNNFRSEQLCMASFPQVISSHYGKCHINFASRSEIDCREVNARSTDPVPVVHLWRTWPYPTLNISHSSSFALLFLHRNKELNKQSLNMKTGAKKARRKGRIARSNVFCSFEQCYCGM